MVSTRHGSALQEVVGPLLTTQILRTNLSGVPRFCDLLARVQRTAVEAMNNCDLPLDRVLAGLSSGSGDLIRTLPVQILILFQQTPDDVWTMGDLQASPLSMPVAVGDEMELTSYELICEIEAHRDTLDIVFRYNADLFEDGLAQEMVAEFASVLASVAANPQQDLASLSGFERDGI
jgi:non-ribosomal peptide synthetase component F